MKKIAIVWGITLIIVFGGLTFFGFKYQEIKDYKKLEAKMVLYAKKYLADNKDLDIENGEKYTVSLKELKGFRPKIDFTVKNDNCDGSVTVKKVLWLYIYNANLKCQKY
jgi:hypothetical protein